MSEQPITDGPARIGYRHYDIYVSGRRVSDFHGSYWAAWDNWREWKDRIVECPEVEQYATTPIEEIPAGYWKNGNVPPLTLAEFEGYKNQFAAQVEAAKKGI